MKESCLFGFLMTAALKNQLMFLWAVYRCFE